MKSILITLVVLASAPFILADIDFKNVRPAEDPKIDIRPNIVANMIGASSKNMASPHIVGGYVATPHSYPHQVAVISKTKEGQLSLCGGSLIDPEWVLTAAHCVMNVAGVTAAVGAHDITKPEKTRQNIPVMKIYLPKTWNPKNVANDIVLLKLEYPAVLNDYVQTIRLPAVSQQDTNLDGAAVEIAGWGKFSDRKESLSPVLRAVGTEVIGNRDCSLHFAGSIKLFHVCADGSKAKGVCSGDSGGPMILTESDGKRTLIGLTSFGRREGCEKLFPTVFTRVDVYLKWISQITGIKLRD